MAASGCVSTSDSLIRNPSLTDTPCHVSNTCWTTSEATLGFQYLTKGALTTRASWMRFHSTSPHLTLHGGCMSWYDFHSASQMLLQHFNDAWREFWKVWGMSVVPPTLTMSCATQPPLMALRQVFGQMREHGIKLRPKKCELVKWQVSPKRYPRLRGSNTTESERAHNSWGS